MNPALFSDTAILKHCTFEIDDKKINIESIITGEIHWGAQTFSTSGYIVMKDSEDIANLLPLNSKNKLEIYAEDGFNDYYFKTFILTKAEEQRDKGKFKAHKFEFVDILSYNMMNTYIGKSYSNKKLSDIINDFFEKFKWKELIDSHVELEIIETETIYSSITIPQDRNFLQWLKEQMGRESLVMYQTRKKIRIGVKADDLLPSKLTKIPHKYSQMHYLSEHPFKIHEHITDFNPVLEQNQNTPIQQGLHFDFGTKTMPITQVDLKDVFDKIKSNTFDSSLLQVTNGIKLFTQNSDEISKVTNVVQQQFLNNSKLHVAVIGNFLHNEIFKNADIELSGNLNHIQGQAEGDIQMSGVYTCVDVVDKFFNNKLTQKLTFVRADFQENK